MEIIFATCIRRTKNNMLPYYQKKFSNFKTDRVFVSEMSPCSPHNGGYAAREFWRRADESEASRTYYDVWFKNASWYGGSEFFIKDRMEGGRPTPRPTVIVGCGEHTECR